MYVLISAAIFRRCDPCCLVSAVQTGGLMVWRGSFLAHLGSLSATAQLRVVSGHVHPFMTTGYPSSDDCFQQDNAPHHKTEIISKRFLDRDSEFGVLEWPKQQ